MTDRNDQRLLSSAHSAVAPRKQRPPSLPKVSREPSLKKRVHRRRTHSAKSMIIIHTRIRPQSNAASENKNEKANDVDIFPSITDLLKTGRRRDDSALLASQSLNEWSNKTAQSTDGEPRHRSLPQSHDDQRHMKNLPRSSTGTNRISKKRLLKSSKVVSVNANDSRGSIQLNSSSRAKISDAWSSQRGTTNELGDIIEQTKKRKKRKKLLGIPCPCSLLCLLGLLLMGLLLGILLAVLLLEFLPKSTTTNKAKMSTSKSSATTSITGASTSTSLPTTTVTSTTTTPHYVCGFSCLNQSWISSTNLLAEWQFDNNLLEDVTNVLTSPAQSPMYTTGYVNQALLFGANANQSLTTSYINILGISFTIDAWIYPTSFPNPQDHSIIGLCPIFSNYECLYLTIRESGGNHILYFGFTPDDLQGNTFVSINEWIHVAFVFEGISLTQSIYINGKLDATATAQSAFKGNAGSVTIGNIPGINTISDPNYFQGIIDRLEVSGRDKSACEILEEATLSAYFTFNSGVSLIDAGPNSLSAVGQSVSFVSTGHSFQAISFNGSTSSYFQISGVTSLGITNRPFSISLWVRPQSLSGTLVHVSANSSGRGWCIPFIGFAANGSIVAQMFNSIIRSVIGPAIPVASTWTHIVQTWSPVNGLGLYINNVLVASTTSMATSYTASSVPNYVILANSRSGAGFCAAGLLGSMSPFNGDIDEFSIYSRELTADDICTLYTN